MTNQATPRGHHPGPRRGEVNRFFQHASHTSLASAPVVVVVDDDDDDGILFI
jgi:hypothetical protein